jgi:hypothetical protein
MIITTATSILLLIKSKVVVLILKLLSLGIFLTTPTPERWTVGNEHNQAHGPDIASAATIAPTHRIHIVSGTTAIVNITPPWTTFSGTIVLCATGIWTWTAAGNIAVLGTVTAAQKAVHFTYHPGTQKWYPSSVA